MLTPDELIQQKNFDKAVFGGYVVDDVDDFIAGLVDDYTKLYKENAVLKSKMKQMVEHVDKYRDKEDSLNRALITAQSTADKLVADTERRCAQMINETERSMRARKEELNRELEETEQSMRARKEELARELKGENERVILAKRTASIAIADVEDRMHKYLARLEQIKQADILQNATRKNAYKAEPALVKQQEPPPASNVKQEESAPAAKQEKPVSIGKSGEPVFVPVAKQEKSATTSAENQKKNESDAKTEAENAADSLEFATIGGQDGSAAQQSMDEIRRMEIESAFQPASDHGTRAANSGDVARQIEASISRILDGFEDLDSIGSAENEDIDTTKIMKPLNDK